MVFCFAACDGGAVDLIFVLDRSGSICNDESVPGCDNWDMMIYSVEYLIENFRIGPYDTRVGVVAYGSRAHLQIGLPDFDNKIDLLDGVFSIPYDPNKGTNTAGGIQLMTQEFQDNPRSGATKIAIIITDGKSRINAGDTIPSAASARNDGIIIYAIGVTENIDENEVRLMSSEPQILDQNYFLSPTFEAIISVADELIGQICILTQSATGELCAACILW